MNTHGESIWKLFLGVLVLLVFMGIGIGHVLYPDYWIKRSGMRRGGEMLTDWNRTGCQFVGLVAILFSAGVLYEIAQDVLAR